MAMETFKIIATSLRLTFTEYTISCIITLTFELTRSRAKLPPRAGEPDCEPDQSLERGAWISEWPGSQQPGHHDVSAGDAATTPQSHTSDDWSRG